MVEQAQPYHFMRQHKTPEFANIYERQEYDRQLVFKPYGLNIPPAGPSEPIERCPEQLACGHQCAGCEGEDKCLPCLGPYCEESALAEDSCIVCRMPLTDQPAVQLGCDHILHAECVRHMLRSRWSTERINFAFLRCPNCQADINGLVHVQTLSNELNSLRILRKNITKQAKKQLEMDIDQADNNSNSSRSSSFSARMTEEEMNANLEKTLFYECQQCHKAFFGGFADCGMGRVAELLELSNIEFICRNCKLTEIGVKDEYWCNQHALRHIQYKCNLCCSVATKHGGPNFYLCEECFNDPKRLSKPICNGDKWKCRLSIDHDFGQQGIPIGKCAVCRSADDRQRFTQQTELEGRMEECQVRENKFHLALQRRAKQERTNSAARERVKEFREGRASSARSRSRSSSSSKRVF